MTKPSASLLAALLSAICLATVSSPVHASGGGEESPPEFNSPWGPVRPLEDLLTGSLGVVEASWWRKPLLLAWYRFNGLNLPAEVRSAFDYTETRGGSADGSLNQTAWFAEAKVAAPDLVPTINPGAESGLLYGNQWDTFTNCPDDAWKRARQTLAERSRLWGGNSAALRDWIAAQHRVFARCPLGPSHYRTDLPGRRINPEYAKKFILPDMSLPDPPSGTPVLLAKDRTYQRAAALFYEGHYKEAEIAFSDIAKDDASPWRELGTHLALRARLRAIQITTPAIDRYDSCQSPECVKARAEILAYRQSEAVRLRADVDRAVAVAKKTGNAEEVRRLTDLDSLVGARLDAAQRFRELATELLRPGIDAATFRRAATDYLHLHRQFPPSEPLSEWLGGLIDGYDPTGAPCAAAPSATTLNRFSLTPEQVRCLRRQWSEESLKRFQKQPTQYAWLFSAAALAERGDAHLETLLKALAAVPYSHVGAASFMVHRLRLGTRDEVMTVAAVLMQRPDVQSDYSARNRVREYRLWHAASLADFWKDALREHGAAFDRDTLLRAAQPDPKGELTWGWDYDTAWILNYELPHSALIETARNTMVPMSLRSVAASMAWSRAILRKDVAAARQALDAMPNPTPQTARFRAIEDDKTLLQEAGLAIEGAHTSGSCHMSAPAAGELRGTREGSYESGTGGIEAHPGRFARNMLSREDYAAWQREREIFESLPDLDSVWMQNVLTFAKAFPDDARAPGLLREAVYRTRMNWCADPSAGELSKRAFELLKHRYPKSKEARTTKYWFKPRT